MAGVRTYNLIMHIHMWWSIDSCQKQGIRWSVTHDRIAGSDTNLSRLPFFLKLSATTFQLIAGSTPSGFTFNTCSYKLIVWSKSKIYQREPGLQPWQNVHIILLLLSPPYSFGRTLSGLKSFGEMSWKRFCTDILMQKQLNVHVRNKQTNKKILFCGHFRDVFAKLCTVNFGFLTFYFLIFKFSFLFLISSF